MSAIAGVPELLEDAGCFGYRICGNGGTGSLGPFWRHGGEFFWIIDWVWFEGRGYSSAVFCGAVLSWGRDGSVSSRGTHEWGLWNQ